MAFKPTLNYVHLEIMAVHCDEEIYIISSHVHLLLHSFDAPDKLQGLQSADPWHELMLFVSILYENVQRCHLQIKAMHRLAVLTTA